MSLFQYRRILASPFRCRKSTVFVVLIVSAILSVFLRSTVEVLFAKDLRHLLINGSLSRYGRVSDLQRPVRILFWTTLYTQFYHWEDWWFKQSLIQEGCPQINCTFTSNRSMIEMSDAVMFHGFHVDLNASDIPKFRHSRQRWIYMINESPFLPHKDFTPFNGLFNWTMTFRNDSDVFNGYGDLLTLPDTNNTQNVAKNYAAGKTKLVGWLVSHCKTKSHREDFVTELRKHIPVDIIGECGTLQCKGRDSIDCYKEIESTYKFYLSFENSICPEYITEKFFAYLSYNVVPVVFGGSGYESHVPKEAYIDALSFPSPRELALYLLQLDKNDYLYNKFFDWKRGLIVKNRHRHRIICELCQKVGDPSLPPKWYDDIGYWWNKKRECKYWKEGKTFVHGGALPP